MSWLNLRLSRILFPDAEAEIALVSGEPVLLEQDLIMSI
jgi:hypothetical protein